MFLLDMTSFIRVFKLFTFLEMPVNITQYRGSVGIFNNRTFAFRPKSTKFTGHTCWSTNHMYSKLYLPIFPMNLVLLLVFPTAVLAPRCSFYIISRNTYASILVITVPLLSDNLWFMCNLLLLCGDVELNPGPNQDIAKNLQFVTGTLIAYLHKTFRSYSFLKRLNQFISLI